MSWLVYDLTGSAVLLGAINGFRALPFLIAGPLGGVAADRMDRRALMEGLRYVRGNTQVLTLIIMALIPMIFAMPFITLMPIFAEDVLGMGAAAWGY